MRSRDDAVLQRFLEARAAGDEPTAARCWEELVERNYDRVRGMVALWGRGGRLSADEGEEAVQRALVRLWNRMAVTFEGATMGEWVNATRQLVEFACLDVQREAARRSRRERSLDEQRPGTDGEPVGAHDARLARLAADELRRAGERADALGFTEWALPRVANPRRRTVLERTLDGVPAEAIAAELEVSMPNLYQLRSRGLRDLADLYREYEA